MDLLSQKTRISLNAGAQSNYKAKDSYRNGQKTPSLIFENLKPVVKSKKYLYIISTSLKVV
jgi:hypothetical protein